MSFQHHDTLTLQKRLIDEANVMLFSKPFIHILHPLQPKKFRLAFVVRLIVRRPRVKG